MLTKLSQFKQANIIRIMYRQHKKLVIFYVVISLIYLIISIMWIINRYSYIDFIFFALTLCTLYTAICIRNKYRSIKVSFIVYIIKHDPIIKKLIELSEQVFSEIPNFYIIAHNTNHFTYMSYSYLISDPYGDLLIQEMKKYQFFSDRHCISFGLLNFIKRNSSPNRLKSIRIQEIREQLNQRVISDI